MNCRLGGLAAVIGVVLCTGVAAAQTSSDQGGSLVVFPKIIADGTRDTLVEITNQSNSLVNAHCFYVNAAATNPGLPPDPILNPPLWQIIDFDITLTKQQPTIWLASAGRAIDPLDVPCSRVPAHYDCYGAGSDPGSIPSLPQGFLGQLTCIEADSSGLPVSGNHLIGNATLKDIGSGDVSRYSAIGLIGTELNDGDGTLCLGGSSSAECPLGAEYEACPDTWILDHRTEGAEVAAVGTGSELSTSVTVMPCTQNFSIGVPTGALVQYLVTNEFEQTFSTATTVTCWQDERLSEINPVIFSFSVLGTPTAQSRIRSSATLGSGILVLGEELRTVTASGISAAAAVNAHVEGTRSAGDLVTFDTL